MRLTAGKIYFWGSVAIIFLTAWNRHSTAQLRTVVDSLKEERMREAERLRQHQLGGQGGVSGTPMATSVSSMPKHFNPYYKQQEIENASTDK
ncbi:hypothetical protein, unknown function [Leishmania mexicana MHOM/GT/2001/U1103]|uniref:Uncharacterized protein n=1 Tax=Leishmania mexicana (strain MHOM/GT/2001/U1103) TaxID=929439 RepID=E9B2Y5_LEIMU|nr:hypothetical protein, unknown function [Leishmania mexicana MHOM/GT/2001/U1103]CBZ29599.1 hypothetical protein, unknown function [Leishmania mexicana MHOM/GT/2001/U1103]